MAFSPVRSAGSVFRAWDIRVQGVGYGTTDPLEEVLAHGYFRAAGDLRPGELIYLRTTPSPVRSGSRQGELHLALLMVRSDQQGAVSARLVQDLGRPDDPP